MSVYPSMSWFIVTISFRLGECSVEQRLWRLCQALFPSDKSGKCFETTELKDIQ